MKKFPIRRVARNILAKLIYPVIIILVLFFAASYVHKIYTDHHTYCNIITPKGQYVNVRKSSIEYESDEYLSFVYPKNNVRLRFIGTLKYAVVCPTNINQHYPLEDSNEMQLGLKEFPKDMREDH